MYMILLYILVRVLEHECKAHSLAAVKRCTYVQCFKLVTGYAGEYFMCVYTLKLHPGDIDAYCVTLPRIVRQSQRDDQQHNVYKDT